MKIEEAESKLFYGPPQGAKTESKKDDSNFKTDHLDAMQRNKVEVADSLFSVVESQNIQTNRAAGNSYEMNLSNVVIVDDLPSDIEAYLAESQKRIALLQEKYNKDEL